MKEIDLEELPKSKPFMNHVRLADKLTKETGLEHSFTFCKHENEILIDRLCTGTECYSEFYTELCGKEASSFHTHPDTGKTRFSPGDIYEASRKSNVSREPNIHCVKSVEDKNVLCQKIIHPTNNDNMLKIWALTDLMEDVELDEDINDDSYYALQRIVRTSMNKLNEHKHILFSGKTGKMTATH